jgi:hypothetical protein
LHRFRLARSEYGDATRATLRLRLRLGRWNRFWEVDL